MTVNSVTRLPSWRRMLCMSCGALWISSASLATSPTGSFNAAPPTSAADAVDQLAEIMVEAREPRFVAPTRRDQIGRIWAPVMINDKGPFRLVLDTGASHSAVTSMVALALGIPTDKAPPVLMRGVTGAATVPAIQVKSLSVGDVAVDSPVLPIVPDAMGGAEGVLGSEGLVNKRIFIDFLHDQITISYSRDEKAAHDAVRIPFYLLHGQLIAVDATVGGVRTRAIIDTGGQTTIANLALRDALESSRQSRGARANEIMGATMAIEKGELIETPPIQLGGIKIMNSGVTFADMYIFKQWKLTSQPAVLVGMDALGTLDTLTIDYRQHALELQTKKIVRAPLVHSSLKW